MAQVGVFVLEDVLRWTYAVTWEGITTSPQTVRGTVVALNYKGAVRKAVRDAASQKPKGTRFQSVLVLVDKDVPYDAQEGLGDAV